MNQSPHIENEISNITICSDMVEKDDHDRYLTTLFVAKDRRRSLNALYAFNIEISKALDSSKELMVSEIKLAWWRDSLEDLNKGIISKHPIVQELSNMLEMHKISIDDLLLIIQTRNEELRGDNPNTLEALIEYCRKTAGTLNRLTLIILSDGQHEPYNNQAEMAGTAWGLIGIIRAISFHAAAQKCFIPSELMAQANIRHEDLYKGDFSDELKQVIKPICDKAVELLNHAVLLVPKSANSAFLLTPLTVSYIKRLKAVSYNIQNVNFEKGTMARLMSLTWAAFTGSL